MSKTQTVEKPESPSVDESLFADQCVDLICKQENTLWQLGQAEDKKDYDGALESIWQMLIQFLDFAEKHFDKDEINQIATPLHAVHAHTAKHKQRLDTHAWKLVRRLIGLESPDDAAINASYEELGKHYLDLFQAFFDVCRMKVSTESAAKDQLDQAASVFIGELADKW